MLSWNKVIWLIQLIVVIVIAMSYSDLASAHSRFVVDGVVPPRSDNDGIKTGPCGGYPRSQNPPTFNTGEQITVEWEETINHPGYFRIAFSPADDLGYDDNVLYQVDDAQNDALVPHHYSATITLPDTACESCSLQLIQYMTERTPPSLYYSCADIRLVSNVPPPDVQNVTSASGLNEINLSWVYPNNDNLGVLILQSDAAISDDPVKQLSYSVGDTIGNSTVVYSGNDNQFVADSLTAGQNYYYKIFAYSQTNLYSPGVSIQETVPDIVNDTLAPSDVTGLTSTPGNGSAELNWINPAEDFYKVLVLWDTTNVQVDPVSSLKYNIGDYVGTARVVFNGLGNAATITNLLAGQSHYFKVYAHDGNFNYAPGVETSAFVSSTGVNQKPQLSLAISQNGGPVTRIYQDKGPVTITLLVQDDNDIAQASISWSGTDTRIIDSDLSPETITFDPSMLNAGTYVVRVTLADNGSPPESATLTLGVEVISPNADDSMGAGSIGHMALLLFLLLLTRYYSSRTSRI